MKIFMEMIRLIFKAVALAMGVAVVAMMIMNIIALESAVLMLAIGLACAGIERLMKSKNNSED